MPSLRVSNRPAVVSRPRASAPRTRTATPKRAAAPARVAATPSSSKPPVEQLSEALKRGDAKSVNQLLSGGTAASSKALNDAWRSKFGRDFELDLRGMRVGAQGLTGKALDQALRSFKGPQLEITASRIAELTKGAKASTAEGRKEIYGLLSTLGGSERALLAETYKKQTGASLNDALKPVVKASAAEQEPLRTPPDKTVAIVVSSGNWKAMLEGKATDPIGGYHYREIEAYVKEALDRGYTPVFFTSDGLPASPDSASLLLNPIGSKFGFGVGKDNGLDSPAGRVILEGLQHPRSIADFDAKQFATMHVAGGHGSNQDLVGNKALEKAAMAMHDRGQIVTAVCHATPALGKLLEGGPATGFSPGLDRISVKNGWVLPEFIPPYDAHAGLRKVGAKLNALSGVAAFTNMNHTETYNRDGVPVVTGTGPEATDDVARKAFDWLERH